MWMGWLEANRGRQNNGGVLRNETGELLISFSKPIGVGDSNEVEVLAIF